MITHKDLKHQGVRISEALGEMREVKRILDKMVATMEKDPGGLDLSFYMNKCRRSWKRHYYPEYYLIFQQIIRRPEDDPMF